MKFHSCPKLIIQATFVIMVLIIISCGPKIKITLKNYKPVLTSDYSIYEGKPIYLMSFVNQANETSKWYYYSRNGKIGYSSDVLLLCDYFWQTFHDMLVKIGMQVSTVYYPNNDVPGIWMTLLRITDEHFRVKVTVQQRGATVFTKIYETPKVNYISNTANLEKRSYNMTNHLFEIILNDQDFKNIFL